MILQLCLLSPLIVSQSHFGKFWFDLLSLITITQMYLKLWQKLSMLVTDWNLKHWDYWYRALFWVAQLIRSFPETKDLSHTRPGPGPLQHSSALSSSLLLLCARMQPLPSVMQLTENANDNIDLDTGDRGPGGDDSPVVKETRTGGVLLRDASECLVFCRTGRETFVTCRGFGQMKELRP